MPRLRPALLLLLILAGCAAPAPPPSSSPPTSEDSRPSATTTPVSSSPTTAPTDGCSDLTMLGPSPASLGTTAWKEWPGGAPSLLNRTEVAQASQWGYRPGHPDPHWIVIEGTTCPYTFESSGLQFVTLAYWIRYYEPHRSNTPMAVCGQGFRDFLFDVQDHTFRYMTTTGTDHGERANASDALVVAMGDLRNPWMGCLGRHSLQYAKNGDTVTASIHERLFWWNETITVRPGDVSIGGVALPVGGALHRTMNVTVECRTDCHSSTSDHASHTLTFTGHLWAVHVGFWPREKVIRETV